MDEKMTSGEIAKKAGVSQKAVRLYDEKGLLKPTEYSEGNYRLYDKEALEILEKIVALKQIGFSLEEIRDNLTSGDAKDIEEALRMQLAVMEEKRYKIEMVIDAIKRINHHFVIVRTEGYHVPTLLEKLDTEGMHIKRVALFTPITLISNADNIVGFHCLNYHWQILNS